MPVGFDDHGAGALDDGAMPQVGGAQIERAVLVDGAGLEDDHIGGRHEPPVVVGDFAEIDRDVVAAPFVVLLPVVAREVQAEGVDVLSVRVGIQDGPRPHAQAMADLDVADFADPGGQRAIEDIGLAQTGA